MKATDVLMEEHEVILRVIAAVEAAAEMIESGAAVRPGFFIDTADFIKGFADGCHHVKEERVLFETMRLNGVPVEGGPIGVMLRDHEQGRYYTRGMRDAAERLEAGEQGAVDGLMRNARGYATLLRQHIYKENNILFPMADRAIPAEEYELVWQGFETVEHEETGEGVHEKYLALAEKLEREAGLN